MITPELWGAIAGLCIGLADFFVLGAAVRSGSRGGLRGGAGSGPLKLIRIMSLFVFPIVGWFVGPIVAESLGV